MMSLRSGFLCATALVLAMAPPFAQADEALAIGNIESLTGPYAVAGVPNGCGLLIAVDAVNERDLAAGHTFELRQEDDQSKPAFATQAASKLTGDGVRFFVGGTGSPTVLATLPIFKDAEALFTGGTSKAEEVLQSGGMVVRINSNAGQDAKAIADYLNETAAGQKIAFVASKGAYADSVVGMIQQDLTEGTEIPYVYLAPADTTNYQSVVTSITADDPDVMLVALASQTQMVAFLRQFKQAGPEIPVVITPGLLFPGVSKAAGGAAEGVVSADIWTEAIDNPANAAFRADYEAYAGQHGLCEGLPMDKQMALSYGQVLLLAQAIAKTQSTDPAVLHKALLESEWELPQGSVRFGENGQALVNHVRIVSEGDTVVPLQ